MYSLHSRHDLVLRFQALNAIFIFAHALRVILVYSLRKVLIISFTLCPPASTFFLTNRRCCVEPPRCVEVKRADGKFLLWKIRGK